MDYNFDKFFVNNETGKLNTAVTIVTGPNNILLYRIVSSTNDHEYDYYTIDQLDENGFVKTDSGTPQSPKYYMGKNGTIYVGAVSGTEYIKQSDSEFQPQKFSTKLSASVPELTGRVDTDATFESLTKKKLPHKVSGSSNYGPWLYNSEQVKDFYRKGIDSKYFKSHQVENVAVTGGEENETTTITENDYLLLGYQIYASKLKGTQPWMFVLDESTFTTVDNNNEIGEVVGIRFSNGSHSGYCRKATADDFSELTEAQYITSSSTTSYTDFMAHVANGKVWIGADSSESYRSNYGMTDNVEDGVPYNFNYDVIVAYPTIDDNDNALSYVSDLRKVTKENSGTYSVVYGEPSDNLSDTSGFKNSVSAYQFPIDAGKDDVTVTNKKDEAIAGYQAYQFKYGNGSYPEFNKYSNSNFKGWLSSYDLNNPVPDLVYNLTSSVDAPGETHSGDGFNGNTIEMNLVDDKVIGQAIAYKTTDGKTLKSIPVLLDSGDYYYHSVTVSVQECDLNKADGSKILPTGQPTEGKDLDWHLYYMTGTDSEWQEYTIDNHAIIQMADYYANPPADTDKYKSITIDFSDIKPYRVRLVHKTELGISNMNMTLKLTPTTDEKSAFQMNHALRNLYELDENGNLKTSDTVYGSYGEEIEGYSLAIDNYAGYRARVKNDTGYTKDLVDIGGDDNHRYQSYWRYNHSEYRGKSDGNEAIPYYSTDDSGNATTEQFHNNNGEIILSDSDYGADPTHQNTRVVRGRAEVSTLEKNAGAEKYAQAVNDVNKSRVNITYTLSGYEGYLVDPTFSDQIIKNVNNLEIAANSGKDSSGKDIKIYSPKREYVYFYDLLPPGVEYDASVAPVVARTKVPTVYDANQQNGNDPEVFVKDYWDTSAAEIVPINESVTAIQASIVQNWNDTSRTLVKFKVHISTDETDYNYDPISKEWFFGVWHSFCYLCKMGKLRSSETFR